MPLIAEIEGLVDQRKVRDDVADHRMLQHGPVLPGRVVAMATCDAAVGTDVEGNQDLAAPTFDPAGAAGRALAGPEFANSLAPRKLGGLMSEGMILAAGDDQILGLSAVDHDVPPGTRVR